MKYKFFYVPLLYFIHTRISGTSKLISWLFLFFLPTFYIQYHFSNLSLTNAFWIYLIQLALVYNMYEMGYIQNDAETIKNERIPTRRLSDEELEYYEEHKGFIFVGRSFLAGILLYILDIQIHDSDGYVRFAVIILLITQLYFIYNVIRSRLTLILHFCLVCLRYLGFPLLFISIREIDPLTVIILLGVFPIINLVERASNKKFGIRVLSGVNDNEYSLSIFRLAYHFLLLVCTIGIVAFFRDELWLAVLVFYLFFIRMCYFAYLYRRRKVS